MKTDTDMSISSSLAPYERRVIELLRNSKDKRARKLAKKRVRLPPHPIYLDTPHLSILSPSTNYPRKQYDVPNADTLFLSSSELSAVRRERLRISSVSSLRPGGLVLTEVAC